MSHYELLGAAPKEHLRLLPTDNKLDLFPLPLSHEQHHLQDLLGTECDSAPLAAEDVRPPLLKHLQHVQLATLLAQPPHQLQVVPFLFQIGD